MSHSHTARVIAREAKVIAHGSCSVFVRHRAHFSQVFQRRVFRAGDRKFQSVNAHVIKVEIAQEAIGPQRLIRMFKSDFNGVDARFIHDGPVLFSDAVTNWW